MQNNVVYLNPTESAMIEQGTPEWLNARLGQPTASRMADVNAKTKTGYGAGRKNYMAELLVERLTGDPTESFISAPMQRGIELEPVARAAYEIETGRDVTEVGYINHPKIAMSGASPDGIVNSHGLIEIKCPNLATHLDTLRSLKVDKKYNLQMQWQMACTGRRWCDFVSYDDRLPPGLDYVCIRVKRDNDLIADMTAEVKKFLEELDYMEYEMRSKMETAA